MFVSGVDRDLLRPQPDFNRGDRPVRRAVNDRDVAACVVHDVDAVRDVIDGRRHRHAAGPNHRDNARPRVDDRDRVVVRCRQIEESVRLVEG